jgi:hypothetical protein
MSMLPDRLHPWRWYAGTVIIEALFRHCILLQSAVSIGARFGRPEDAVGWRSLRRWRKQLLVSPTLWGWLGARLSITKPATNRNEGRIRLERLVAEGGCIVRFGILVLEEMSGAVRSTFRDLVHDRKKGVVREVIPGRFFVIRFVCPIVPGFTHREGLWSGPALMANPVRHHQ